jgi:hypothetical protein
MSDMPFDHKGKVIGIKMERFGGIFLQYITMGSHTPEWLCLEDNRWLFSCEMIDEVKDILPDFLQKQGDKK